MGKKGQGFSGWRVGLANVGMWDSTCSGGVAQLSGDTVGRGQPFILSSLYAWLGETLLREVNK